jgi:integrase
MNGWIVSRFNHFKEVHTMASIVKRNKKYSVVYSYTDSDTGTSKQKWEACGSLAEARKRRAEIELGNYNNGMVEPPKRHTVSDLLHDFVSIYGKDRWGLSVYDSNTALIDNYINPVIGQMEVRGITPRIADNYIAQLQKMPPVSTATRKARTATIPPKTIEKIVKLLRTAFKQAVRWEMTTRNPFENVLVPRTKYTKRDIWTAETIRDALDACKDSRLYVAINLSFACSCRLGEILGLTWDNVHITDDDIAKDDASIYIDKELARCSLKALEALNGADVIKIFEPINKKAITRVVLKKPKTDSSIRKIWLPRTLAYILRDWRKTQSDLKAFLGEEYEDNDLVVCLQDGRPCETRIIEEAFQHLKEDAGLPNVVFHSLRHSSTTYKLKLNHGDLKATQGDTGHAELDMITNVYAHILDEDRKVNAQKFEASFYADPNLHAPALHKNIPVPEETPTPATLDIAVLIDQLRQNPDLAATLAKLVLEQKTVRP